MKIIKGFLDDYGKPHMFILLVNDDAAEEVLNELEQANTDKVLGFEVLSPDTLEYALSEIKECNKEDDLGEGA
jgi:hypothetical protein